jgi:hypothetical protein
MDEQDPKGKPLDRLGRPDRLLTLKWVVRWRGSTRIHPDKLRRRPRQRAITASMIWSWSDMSGASSRQRLLSALVFF